MLKNSVLYLLCMMISLHVTVSMASLTKSFKPIPQETTKNLEPQPTEEKSEKETETNHGDLVLINHFHHYAQLTPPYSTTSLYLHYIFHYQSLPPKVPTQPPPFLN